ncbi:MAG TPA: DUF488 domain-containing protein [Stellaceae bacterium]
MPLFTIGYEGMRIDDFLDKMQQEKIKLVVDVRALPLSRKRGFSKTALAAALTQVGIRYAHRVALGTPKPIRARYKHDHDFAALRVEFEKYLAHQTLSLQQLVELVRDTRACLLCFEADPALCHRSLVADAAMALGAPPATHL